MPFPRKRNRIQVSCLFTDVCICIFLVLSSCSQALVLPPFQKLGLGAKLIQTFYNLCYSRPEVLDITGNDLLWKSSWSILYNLSIIFCLQLLLFRKAGLFSPEIFLRLFLLPPLSLSLPPPFPLASSSFPLFSSSFPLSSSLSPLYVNV